MEVADRRTACESSSSGLSPKRMPHYPIGILFYYYISKQFQIVSYAGTNSFKRLKLQFHALETLVSS